MIISYPLPFPQAGLLLPPYVLDTLRKQENGQNFKTAVFIELTFAGFVILLLLLSYVANEGLNFLLLLEVKRAHFLCP